MSPDITVLAAVLTWLVSAPGAGLASYFLMEKIPALAALSAELKRYASLALAALLAMAVFSAGVGLGYAAMPADVQGWGEALFAVAFVASGLGQTIHGRVKLRTQ